MTYKKQYIAALSASLGAFCSGTILGWTSPVGPRLLQEIQYFPITTDQWSWIASIYNVGCAFSCLFIGYFMDKFGRKRTMLGLVVPLIIGWALLAWANNFLMLLTGRFILGLGGGAFYITVPQYTSEISQKEIRGILGSFLQLLISIGVLFVYIGGAVTTVFWTNIICGTCPLIFAIIFSFMPESPVYLIIKNREQEAQKALEWLCNKDFDVEQWRENFQGQKVSLKEALKEKSSVAALVIGFGLLYFRHMACIIPILFYATTIFAIANVGISADVSTIILGIMQCFSSLMASLLIDRVGRRKLLLGSIVTMTAMLFSIGSFFYTQSIDHEIAKGLGWLPLSSLCVYILAYPVGYGGVPWLIVSEVSPKNIKAFSGPITGFFAWNFAFLVTTSFSSLMNNFGVGETFWIFASGSVLGILFTFFVIPETKGKSLMEIEKELNKVR